MLSLWSDKILALFRLQIFWDPATEVQFKQYFKIFENILDKKDFLSLF